jgi:hypothetical protein
MQLVDNEHLMIMREEDIINIQNIFRRKLLKAQRSKEDISYIVKLEIELNYIYRELEIRDHRRKAHLEFMNTRANRSRRNS